MVRGISTKRVKRQVTEDPAARDKKREVKLARLAKAIKIPAQIHQFSTTLSPGEEERFVNLFSKYMPETKEAKKERLSSADPKSGPKPIIVKFGLNHIADLIEQKRLKLVLVAASVDPITLVMWVPTFCRKMGIPYAIVKDRTTLGKLVRMKAASIVGLEDCRPEDSAEFGEIIDIANAKFMDQYEKHMKTSGGMMASKCAEEAK